MEAPSFVSRPRGRKGPRQPEVGGRLSLCDLQTHCTALGGREGNWAKGKGQVLWRARADLQTTWGAGTDPRPCSTVRTPEVDKEALEKFDKALKALPMHIRLAFNPTQLEGEHPGPAPSPGQEATRPRTSSSHGDPQLPRPPRRRGWGDYRPPGHSLDETVIYEVLCLLHKVR